MNLVASPNGPDLPLAKFSFLRWLASSVLVAGRRSTLLIMSLWFAACTTLPHDEALRLRNQLLHEQKVASLHAWRKRLGQNKLASADAQAVVVRVIPAAATRALHRGWVSGGGTAVALTPDGYYLTAAHNIGRAPLVLATPTPQGWRTGSVRVVWSGRSLPQGPDVAIVHSSLKGPHAAPLAPWEAAEASRALPLLAAGWGTEARNPTTPQAAAGQLKRLGPARSQSGNLRWRQLHHTIPLVRGDSGAPLLNARGEIIGLHTGGEFDRVTQLWGRPRLHDWISIGVQLDPRWIESVIAEDRARR